VDVTGVVQRPDLSRIGSTKAIVLYHSATGNIERVAKTIVTILNELDLATLCLAVLWSPLLCSRILGFQGIRSKVTGALRHFVTRLYEEWSVGRAHIEHFQPFRFNTDLLQQLPGVAYPLFCSQISFQEMAAAFLSASDEGGIGAIFECLQQV
jgi:hypothetical protein